jgi:hypothetical protein
MAKTPSLRVFPMKQALVLATIAAGLVAAGCTSERPAKGNSAPSATTGDKEAKIQANLDKLDPGDRKLAAAQRWCAVEDENRLGAMGVPYKVMVKDQPVFLCCDHCQKRALADPEKTLAKVEELKKKAAAFATP